MDGIPLVRCFYTRHADVSKPLSPRFEAQLATAQRLVTGFADATKPPARRRI